VAASTAPVGKFDYVQPPWCCHLHCTNVIYFFSVPHTSGGNHAAKWPDTSAYHSARGFGDATTTECGIDTSYVRELPAMPKEEGITLESSLIRQRSVMTRISIHGQPYPQCIAPVKRVERVIKIAEVSNCMHGEGWLCQRRWLHAKHTQQTVATTDGVLIRDETLRRP
jgi:hypothetical protein